MHVPELAAPIRFKQLGQIGIDRQVMQPRSRFQIARDFFRDLNAVMSGHVHFHLLMMTSTKPTDYERPCRRRGSDALTCLHNL
jgi:hypothetical protein